VTVKLKYRAQAKKSTSSSKTSSYSHTLLKQQILYRKNCIQCIKSYSRFSAIISASINVFAFCTKMENRQPKGFQFSEIRFSKIQDGGRPPSCISIFGHYFGVDQHFCAKFGTEMENRQPKGTQCSEIRFSKIQDGVRPPSWISILGRNFGVAQHYCAKLGTVMENR